MSVREWLDSEAGRWVVSGHYQIQQHSGDRETVTDRYIQAYTQLELEEDTSDIRIDMNWFQTQMMIISPGAVTSGVW